RLAVLGSISPIALCIKIADLEYGLVSQLDSSGGKRDFPGDERLPAPGGLMIEENTVAGEEIIGFPVIDDNPVTIELRDSIGTARVERGLLGLRDLPDAAKKLACRRLVKFRFHPRLTDRVEESQRAHRVDLSRIFGHIERHFDVTLGGKIVNLIG